MENTPDLYDTLFQILSQHRHWIDIRHLHTLLWMVVGLIHSKTVNLPDWVPFVNSRAQYAQSTVRRFSRWLHNERIQPNELWLPIIRTVLQAWQAQTLYLVLDTTRLWDRYTHIRVAMVYRGRAIPIAWKTIEHGSSTVGFSVYQEVLATASRAISPQTEVVLLADRGFADTRLMQYLTQELHWHYRLRIRASFFVYRPGRRPVKVARLALKRGQALLLHGVFLTRERYGPVHLALAKPLGTTECWYLVSDQPTSRETFAEYGLRFEIEESFLDDKSGGFQLESSLFRSPEAISRLGLALAATTLFLVSQGTQVVAQGKRRLVDAHWFRGNSYLKIGWNWVLRALSKGEALINLNSG
jgi:hypothetical protein